MAFSSPQKKEHVLQPNNQNNNSEYHIYHQLVRSVPEAHAILQLRRHPLKLRESTHKGSSGANALKNGTESSGNSAVKRTASLADVA